MLDHRVLTMVGPATEGIAPGGLPYGAMTGLTYQRLAVAHPPTARAAVRRRADPGSRDALFRGAAAGARSSGLVDRHAQPEHAPEAGRGRGAPGRRAGARDPRRHARDGPRWSRCLGTGVTGLEVRAALATALRPDSRRATFLEAIAARRGRLVLGDCWPELALVACWLGGSAGIQARHLEAHFDPRIARRDLGLVASEGRLTIPVEDDSAAGVLAVHTNFYEFVAEEDIDDPAAAHAPQPRARRGPPLLRDRDRRQRSLPLRHERRRRGPRLPRPHAQGGVRAQGPRHAEHHRREAPPQPRPARRARGRARDRAQASGSSVLIPDVEAGRYDLLVELPRSASLPLTPRARRP